jgi:site-specific DNA-methyltransferase (adenine-specific)
MTARRTLTSHLIEGDALEMLERLPAESVDLAVTDPPYESLEKHRAIGTTTRLSHSKASSNDWFRVIRNEDLPNLFAALHRVLKHNTHLYLFCDHETAFVAKPAGEGAGFKFWKPLVWDKQKIGMGYHYRARYELVLFFEKGKRRLADLGVPDVLSFPRVHRGYPAEKPVELIRTLIRQSSARGGLVVDPFMGSGSTAVAAANEGRNFVGSDIKPVAVSMTSRRVSDLSVHVFVDARRSHRNSPSRVSRRRPNSQVAQSRPTNWP